MSGTGTGPDRKRHTDELVDTGALVPVRVEGHKPLVYAPADDVPRLNGALEGQLDPAADRQIAFIAPLDPFIWDRQIARDIFGFDYVWEVYVPEHKRRWGYYVLPILFGDRLVGRIEPRLERKSGTLRILGTWWERDFVPRSADGFVPAMRAALREYMTFVGASSIEWAPAAGGAGKLIGTLRRR